MVPHVKLVSFIFWENFEDTKRHFEINWPLAAASKIYGGGPDFIVEVIKKRKKIEIAYVIPLFI